MPLAIVHTPMCSGPIETLQMKPPTARTNNATGDRAQGAARARPKPRPRLVPEGRHVKLVAAHVRQRDRDELVVEQVHRLLGDQLARLARPRAFDQRLVFTR